MWQALHEELKTQGATVVTVALDSGGIDAVRPFVEAAAPTHPSLLDEAHVTDELLGFCNVPMSVWIDEEGRLVRPAEHAAVRPSPLRQMEIPDNLPEQLRETLGLVKQIPEQTEEYLSALRDWVAQGRDSRFALSPAEVIARSRPRSPEEARAAACFSLGWHLHGAGDEAGAVQWWREAHRLDPSNWTYKRQAWALATTAPGAQTNLLQGPTEQYEGDWVRDIKQLGPENYYPAFRP